MCLPYICVYCYNFKVFMILAFLFVLFGFLDLLKGLWNSHWFSSFVLWVRELSRLHDFANGEVYDYAKTEKTPGPLKSHFTLHFPFLMILLLKFYCILQHIKNKFSSFLFISILIESILLKLLCRLASWKNHSIPLKFH